MRRLRFAQLGVLLAALLVGIIGSIHAQDIVPATPPADDADIAISFPPPVYVLRGTVEIRGTAMIPNLSNYFVEFRPLQTDDTGITGDPQDTADLTPTPEERPWFPATLPNSIPVEDGVLGSWNTTTTRDGLYEMRLVINRTDGGSEAFELRPIRIENNPPEFVDIDVPGTGATPVPTPGNRPTIAPTPTSLNQEPTVTAIVDANIRRGDSTSYPRIDALLQGETAPVLGISTINGWYYIEVDGRRGFIAPSTVRFEGNADELQFINPPATPTPTPTNTPVPQGNLQVTGLRLDPVTPQCGDSFNIFINVQNTGSSPTGTSSTLEVRDTRLADGSTQGTTIGGFPVLNPGQSFVVVTTLTISTFVNEDHRIIVTLDPNNVVDETNENDNTQATVYTLQPPC